MLPTERQQDPYLRTRTEGCHRGLGKHPSTTCCPGCSSCNLQCRIRQLALTHPFGSMTRKSVDDFMSQYRSQSCFGPCNRENPGIDCDLSARQRERIHGFVVLDDRHFPPKLLRDLSIFRSLRRLDNPSRNPLDWFDLSWIVRLPN